MCTYNAERTVEQAIGSILNQTYRDFEFLIIDDGSSDHTPQLIEAQAAADSRIRLLRHHENKGLTARLNEGLLLTEAEYVFRMDADDESNCERIESQYAVMKRRRHVAAAGSYIHMMGVRQGKDRLVKPPVTHDEIARILPTQNCIFHPSVVLRRSVILDEGLYRSEFLSAQDYDLWLRLCRKGHELTNVPLPLLRYRYSVSGITLARKWEQLFYVLMAQTSHEFPEMALDLVREIATRRQQEYNKKRFLRDVAGGTCRDLLRLGQRKETFRILDQYGRQLGVANTLILVAKLLLNPFRKSTFLGTSPKGRS